MANLDTYKNITLDMQLAYYAAPTMLGIKPASLFWCRTNIDGMHDQVNLFNEYSKGKGFAIKRIDEGKKHIGIFVYHRSLFEHYLSDTSNMSYLQQFGYKLTLTPEEKLAKLFERMKTCFPHEIGIFLGYPIRDVAGFIDNKGRNYILRGSWLVYSNPEYACRLFYHYKLCRNWLVGKIMDGMSIYDVLNIKC